MLTACKTLILLTFSKSYNSIPTILDDRELFRGIPGCTSVSLCNNRQNTAHRPHQGAVHQPINRGDNAHEITSPCGQQHVYRLLLSGRAGSQLLHRGRLGEDSLRHGLLKHFHQKRTGHGNRPGSDHPHRLVPRTQRPHRRAESPGGALRPFPNPSHRPPALLRA